MEQQEYLIKLSMIEQEAQKLEERITIFNSQIQEMNAIKKCLEEIENKNINDKDGEILSNLGKGIFIKTEIKSKDLFVNVGKNIVIKKNTKETVKILDDQLKKLSLGKEETTNRIIKLQVEMQNLIQEAQKEQEKERKGEFIKKTGDS